MTQKHFFGLTLIIISFISLQSCSNDYLATSDEETLKSESIETRDDITEAAALPIKKYCKYNVKESSVPNIKDGDIVCFPCATPCEDIEDKPYRKRRGADIDTLGYITGSTTGGTSCQKCGSGKKSI